MTNPDSCTETVSSKVPMKLYREIQAMALADDMTVSEVNRLALAEYAAKKRRVYVELSRVYREYPDLSDGR